MNQRCTASEQTDRDKETHKHQVAAVVNKTEKLQTRRMRAGTLDGVNCATSWADTPKWQSVLHRRQLPMTVMMTQIRDAAAALLTMTSVFSGSVPLSGVGTLSSPTPGVSAVTGGTWETSSSSSSSVQVLSARCHYNTCTS
jgi:hypothetical protein